MVDILLNHTKIDVNFPSSSTKQAREEAFDCTPLTPLYIASGFGNVPMVKRLLAHPLIEVNTLNDTDVREIKLPADKVDAAFFTDQASESHVGGVVWISENKIY